MSKLKLFIARVLVLLVIFLVIITLYHGARFFLLLFAGALIAILWRGVSRWLAEKTNAKFKYILPAVIILNIGLIVLFFWLSSPNITEQVNRLAEKIPQVIERVEESMRNSLVGQEVIQGFENGGMSDNQMKQVFNVFSGTLNFLVDIVLILAFALFLSFDPGLYRKGIMELVPSQYKDTAKDLLNRLRYVLYRWFLGKILDMFSIFVMTIIGLWILDMPMIFTFALIAFFFSFVPNIGPIISAIPPVAIAFLDSPQKALYVGLLYLGIQMTESYLVTPNVQKRASYVPPVVLLLVQFLLAKFLGVLGLFLSTPLLILVMVAVNKLYIENYLGKKKLQES